MPSSREVLAACGAGALLLYLRARAARRGREYVERVATTGFEAYLVDAGSAGLANGHAAHAADPHAATSFEAYLKSTAAGEGEGGQAGAGGDAGAGVGPGSAAPPSARRRAPSLPGDAVPVPVLFATEFGFSREVAEELAAALRAAGAESGEGPRPHPILWDVAKSPAGWPGLRHADAVVVVSSTQGEGVPPSEARGFFEWLDARAPGEGPARFAVAALGDRSYARFAAAGRRLDAALERLGGERLVERVDVHQEDWTALKRWIGEVVGALVALARAGELRAVDDYGGPDAPTLPDPSRRGAGAASGGPPPPRPALGSRSNPLRATVLSVEPLCSLPAEAAEDEAVAAAFKQTARVALDLSAPDAPAYLPGDALGVWPENDPAFVAELLALLRADGDERVPAPGWAGRAGGAPVDEADGTVALADALRLEYELKAVKPSMLAILRDALVEEREEEPREEPGSKNRGGEEEEPREEPGSKNRGGEEEEPREEPGSKNRGGEEEEPRSTGGEGEAGGEGSAAGGASGARRAALPPVALRRADLEALIGSPSAAEAHLSSRWAADLLREWGSRPEPARLLAGLRQLAPRLYSISSAPSESADPARAGKPSVVEATVSIVRYADRGGRARGGVASTELGERLAPGQTVPVYVHPNPDFRLPDDVRTPILMVGPGTGLAPFRAFLHARRAAARAAGLERPGPAMLFFGCRRRDEDFLYAEELQSFADAGELDLVTAFSRERRHAPTPEDQAAVAIATGIAAATSPRGSPPKLALPTTPAPRYVQHAIAQRADDVARLVAQGAHVYICGDGGGMAPAVERAIAAAIAGDGTEDAGRAKLDALADEGRFQKDVWIL